MNPEQLLNQTEVAMAACRDHTFYRYTLYIVQGGIYCKPALDLPPDAVHVYSLTRYQLEKGLTPFEWNQLRDKLTKIWKELKL